MASKTKAKPITTLEEFESAVDAIARLQLDFVEVSARHNTAMEALDRDIKADLEKRKKEIKSQLERAGKFAAAHTATLFEGGEKTAETPSAKYGFRTAPESIKALNRAWTTAASIEAILEAEKPELLTYTPALNKTALAEKCDEEELATYGLKRAQGETFWIAPNLSAPVPASRLSTVTA